MPESFERIKTGIIYIPSLQPLPLPQRRRDAYDAAALLPCPMNLPEEWFTCPTVNVYGAVRVDGQLRQAKVECKVCVLRSISNAVGLIVIAKAVSCTTRECSTQFVSKKKLRKIFRSYLIPADPSYLVSLQFRATMQTPSTFFLT